MSPPPYTTPLRHPNMRCEDCKHSKLNQRSGEYFCDEAREALILAGFPFAIVIVDLENSAEICPMFERSQASKDGECMPGWMAEENATERGVRAARGYEG